MKVEEIIDFFSSCELLQAVLLKTESSFILNHEKLQSHKLIKPFVVLCCLVEWLFDISLFY